MSTGFLIAVILIALAVCYLTFRSARIDRKARKEAEAKSERQQDVAEQTAHILTEANNEKEQINNDNSIDDVNAAINILHHHATGDE